MKQRSPWRYLWSTPDIRKKLLITVFIMVIYRLVSHVPVPGVDREALQFFLSGGGPGATLIQMVNMIAGGTIQNFSILAMGVYPYITAQIILQLLTPIVPSWQARMEDDPREGRKWMEKMTYYLSVFMAALTSFGQIQLVSGLAGVDIIPEFGQDALRTATIIISMTAGTMFAIWLGELISEYGIRNQGLSLLIFAGIISQMPRTYLTLWQTPETRYVGTGAIIGITLLTIFVIVFVQQGRRNVPVMYPGRRVGARMSMPVKGTLPLMVNMSGMIPLIFASAILQVFPIVSNLFVGSETAWVASAAGWFSRAFDVTQGGYWTFYFFMVVIFAFFYTDVLFQQQAYGENLKRSGARIPGVSPGAPTQRYLNRVLRRITLPGAVFLGLVAILPYIATKIFPVLNLAGGGGSAAFLINASGLLIVVGVVRDTFFNIEAELKVHGYEESLLVR